MSISSMLHTSGGAVIIAPPDIGTDVWGRDGEVWVFASGDDGKEYVTVCA